MLPPMSQTVPRRILRNILPVSARAAGLLNDARLASHPAPMPLFPATTPRQDNLYRPIDPQSGETKDAGLGLSLLDGRLDEEIYRQVRPQSDFIQQEPNEGQPATEATDVWVFFDENDVLRHAGATLDAQSAEWVMPDYLTPDSKTSVPAVEPWKRASIEELSRSLGG